MSYHYDYNEFEDYEEDIEYDDDDEYDDPDEYIWVDEWEVSTPLGGGFSSLAVTGLMPVMAIGVSIVMLLVFLRFVFSQMPDIELPVTDAQTRQNSNVVAIAPFFSPSVQYWEPKILQWAEQWQMDANLIATVMQIESCGNPDVVSIAGATGLFQVMPFHFQASEDPFNPDTNALRGMAYLSRSLESFGGNVKMALAGYNAGINGASRGETLWPAETVRYTHWGVGIYEDAKAGRSESPTLNDWLSRAKGMCNNAAQKVGVSP
ncbi:MAG TPA: lytic transglycosylase domain-containing protein [Anaerolineales bacterium]|nr:lytic transglycosylase domain-containing protein [Anaerolineales bacterium]